MATPIFVAALRRFRSEQFAAFGAAKNRSGVHRFGTYRRREGLSGFDDYCWQDGKPSDPKVISSLGYGLDEKAIEAVLQWTFKPAQKNGTAVSVPATIEVNFQLITKGRGSLRAMTFTREPDVTPPVMIAVDLPPAFGSGEVALEFTVTSEGNTSNYKAIGTLPAQDEKLLLESLRKWKFRPAVREGQPVTARGKVVYYVQ